MEFNSAHENILQAIKEYLLKYNYIETVQTLEVRAK